MFIELHLLDNNRKMMLNINKIQCISQVNGITGIDQGDVVFRVKESYEQIHKAISKITLIESVESEDNENGK